MQAASKSKCQPSVKASPSLISNYLAQGQFCCTGVIVIVLFRLVSIYGVFWGHGGTLRCIYLFVEKVAHLNNVKSHL